MKKIFFLFCLLALLCIPSFATNYNVSFISNNAVAKISYAIEKNGSLQNVDMSKFYEISSIDKIYVYLNIGSENIDVNSVRLRSWDGEKNDIRDVEFQLDKEGRPYFCLGDLGSLVEWSVEPILNRIPIILKVEAICGVTHIGGTWKVNSDEIKGSSIKISSLSDYSVSFNFDEGSYYFVSASPKQLAYSNGNVIFSLQKPSDNSNVDDTYIVNLERYSTFSFGEKGEKMVKIVYNGSEYLPNEMNTIKLRKKESISVFTRDEYVVEKGSGLIITSQARTADGYWETVLQIPEDSDIYDYVINICRVNSVIFPIELVNFIHEENAVYPSVFIPSSNGPSLFNSNDDFVEIKENESLIISIPSPNKSNVKYSINFQSFDGSLSEFNEDDIKVDYERSFTYNQLKSIEKITIVREVGYRVNGIEAQVQRAKDINVDIGYYVLNSGKRIKDGDFLPLGTEVSVEISSSIPDGKIIRINSQELFEGSLLKITTINEDSSIFDFSLDVVDVLGFEVDFDSISSKYKKGTISFMRNGIVLKGKVFVKVGDEIQWTAKVNDENYEISGDSGGTIYIQTEDQKSKFENLSVSFVEKNKLINRTIILKNPKYGSVKYYNSNGSEIRGNADGETYAVVEALVQEGGTKTYRYEYISKNSGFNYPDLTKETINKTGWSCIKEKDYIICEKEIETDVVELYPVELVESEDVKPSVSVDIEESLIKSAKTLDVFYENSGKKTYIYTDGTRQDINSKKISSTDALTLHFTGYELVDGQVLELQWIFTNQDDTKLKHIRRFTSVSESIKIDGFLSSKGKTTTVKSIDITFKITEAAPYKEKQKDNATISVKVGEKSLSLRDYMNPNDTVTLIVEAKEGYYLVVGGKNQDSTYSKETAYKDLDDELNKIEVRKYINVTLYNINPSGNPCEYTKDNKSLELGTHRFKEGDKISISLQNKEYECKKTIVESVHAWKNGINSILNNGQIKSEITITSDYDTKTLTLKDFEIFKKGE